MRKYLFLFVCQICVILSHGAIAVDICTSECLNCAGLGYSCKTYDPNCTSCCTACDCSLVSCKSGYYVDKSCNCVKSELGGLVTGRCDKGQYWVGALRDGYCEQCPNGGTTPDTIYDSLLGSVRLVADITDCYIPAGQTMTDASGSYSFTADCAYTE